ncbi:MAG: hypothetical protein QM541_06900 [Flavobacterium sp.]|nr:hypothetical protein [Flavobacterium sp.]
MSSLLKNISRFLLFILVQVYMLNYIRPLHQFIVPYFYFLYILWLPFNINRFWLLAVGFTTGLTLDYFTGTMGLHAAPCTLIAYLRPYIINILIPQDTIELSYTEPSVKSMGIAPYALYIVFFTFIHHAYLTLIEWLNFGNALFFFGKVLGTTGISILLIAIIELLFFRKGKFRTNA